MEITYKRVGDYEIPMLTSTEAAIPTLGMYAQMRLDYLKNHRRALYTNLLTTGKLNTHLAEMQTQASDMMERITSQMMKREEVNERLKKADRMAWVGRRNNIQASARETVIRELIHS